MTINPHFEEYPNETGRLFFGDSLQATATVTSSGEVMRIDLNFVERCERVRAVTLDIRGEASGWTLDRQYVVSTDGSTWSNPMDIVALLALSINPALPFYLGLRFTATGTPAGAIGIWHCQVDYDIDFNGVTGRREHSSERLYVTCREVIEQLVAQISPVYDEQVHYQFAWGTGEKCVPDGNKPNVFCHELKTVQRSRNSNHRQITIGFRFGIRRKCNPVHKYFEEFRGIVKERFGEMAQDYTYDLTINGTRHLGVRLADIGFWSVMSSGDAEIQGSENSNKELACGCTWWETSIQMQILFKFGKNLR